MDKNNELRFLLAGYAHNAWAGWMQYLFSQSHEHYDGAVTIPAPLVARWKRQMKVHCYELPDNEQTSDYKEADKILEICGLTDG